MPQEFQVVCCYDCHTFQVQQVKKKPKWVCKMCGARQSLKKVYGCGPGVDCRRLVQTLNMKKSDIIDSQSIDAKKMHSADIHDSHSIDAKKMHSSDIHDYHSIDAKKMHSSDIHDSHSIDAKKMHSSDVHDTHSVDAKKMHSSDIHDSHSIDAKKMHSADIHDFHSIDANSNTDELNNLKAKNILGINEHNKCPLSMWDQFLEDEEDGAMFENVDSTPEDGFTFTTDRDIVLRGEREKRLQRQERTKQMKKKRLFDSQSGVLHAKRQSIQKDYHERRCVAPESYISRLSETEQNSLENNPNKCVSTFVQTKVDACAKNSIAERDVNVFEQSQVSKQLVVDTDKLSRKQPGPRIPTHNNSVSVNSSLNSKWSKFVEDSDKEKEEIADSECQDHLLYSINDLVQTNSNRGFSEQLRNKAQNDPLNNFFHSDSNIDDDFDDW